MREEKIMKKKMLLGLGVVSLFACSMVAVCSNAPSTVNAEGESVSVVDSSSATDSSVDSSSNDDIKTKVDEEVAQILNAKVYGTITLGALVLFVAQLVLWWVTHYGTSGDIKKALGILNTANEIVSKSDATQKMLLEQHDGLEKDFAKAIEALNSSNKTCALLAQKVEGLTQDNKMLHEALDTQKNILLIIAKDDPDLVKSGAYKEITDTLGGK